MRVTWVQPADLLRHELWQSAAEGRDVSSQLARWTDAGGIVGPPHVGASGECYELSELASELLLELDGLPEVGADKEPSDWAEILATLPLEAAVRPRTDDFSDRILAAWTGRAVGCVLGKPVEKIPRVGIEEILRSNGRWPLDRWITAVGVPTEVTERWPWNKASKTTSMEENIDGTPEDDDLNYALMALRVVEKHGRDFTPNDVAQGWLLDLPAGRSFTAERVAYRNLLEGVSPPMSARIRNPYREWIGAQIRTDVYGWVSPGDPLRAAELAWRDACVSHTRNGLYGAMAVAAMCSMAVVAGSVDEVLDAGLGVVPPQSRMHRALAYGRSLADLEPTTAYGALEAEFAGMHWVHALNNAALVAYALAASRGDFDRAICLTVMGGWDTDSNGATVGSIAGALGGTAAIAERWTAPLKGRLASALPDCDGVTFTDLANRTVSLAG